MTQRRTIKIDGPEVIDLATKGLTATQIAKTQGVAISTITRYLQAIEPEIKSIDKYLSKKSHGLALSQLKQQAIVDTIQDAFLERREELKTQDLRLLKEIHHTMQGGKYYDDQMYRLETGQSTSNIAQLVGHIEDLQRSGS